MRGFGYGGWLITILLLLAIPVVLMGWNPGFKYIFLAVIALSIYGFFRNFFGDSVLTLVLTGIIFYFLVWRHQTIALMGWWLYTLLATGILSTLGWGYIWIANVLRGGKR